DVGPGATADLQRVPRRDQVEVRRGDARVGEVQGDVAVGPDPGLLESRDINIVDCDRQTGRATDVGDVDGVAALAATSGAVPDVRHGRVRERAAGPVELDAVERRAAAV